MLYLFERLKYKYMIIEQKFNKTNKLNVNKKNAVFGIYKKIRTIIINNGCIVFVSYYL